MKSVLLYVALVGIPLLGVLGILQAGRALVPPPAFAGTWRVTASPDSDAEGGCVPPTSFRVEQSGRRARVLTEQGAVTADIEGLRFRTRAPLAGGGACAGWRVEAEGRGRTGTAVVEGAVVPAALAGRLVPAGCACAPVAFQATREAPPPAETAH